MKRRLFWLFGLGGAAGAQIKSVPPGPPGPILVPMCKWENGQLVCDIDTNYQEPRIPKPPPNACPLCGTVAKPYVRVKVKDIYRIEVDVEAGKKWDADHPGETRTFAITKPQREYYETPEFYDIACAHCSVIFRQLAEDVKP